MIIGKLDLLETLKVKWGYGNRIDSSYQNFTCNLIIKHHFILLDTFLAMQSLENCFTIDIMNDSQITIFRPKIILNFRKFKRKFFIRYQI